MRINQVKIFQKHGDHVLKLEQMVVLLFLLHAQMAILLGQKKYLLKQS
jgi:hypothetical protein